MQGLPLFMDMRNRTAIVVGGTVMAQAKARLALKAQAHVVVFTQEMTLLFDEFVREDRFTLEARTVTDTDFAAASVVYIATGDETEDARLAALVSARQLPVNVVDRPDLSSFSTPAIVDRDPITIAISTGGTAPVLARMLRRQLEETVSPGLGHLARLAGELRGTIKKLLPTMGERRRFWEGVFDPTNAAYLAGSSDPHIRQTLIRDANTAQGHATPGRVLLVGAGPGDPELLTLKAHRALSKADVIVHDRLIGPGILDLARRDAERFYVGKERSNHSVPQDGIHDLLVREARAGKTVIRLKGGDPFVFGRGGEEVQALRAAGIEVDIVPGITAAIGCAASAEIPLTHRDHSDSVTFITGQMSEGGAQDWRGLAGRGRTLVVYMGLASADSMTSALIRDGFDADTAVAIIEKGTTADERRHYATLGDLPALIRDKQVTSPALLIIGEVARLAKDWPTDAEDTIQTLIPHIQAIAS